MKNILFLLAMICSQISLSQEIEVCIVRIKDFKSGEVLKQIDTKDLIRNIKIYVSEDIEWSNGASLFISDEIKSSKKSGVRSFIDMGDEKIITYNDSGLINVFYKNEKPIWLTYRRNYSDVISYHSCSQ